MNAVLKVYSTSPFYRKVKKGDILLQINGKNINDLLDYMFYSAEEKVKLKIERNGEILEFEEEITEGELRIDFDNYLMDTKKSCKNKCIFCFIDQLPENMRETMYYKDDDFRLSILYGNYVTLTNLTEEDCKRIKDLKVSPLNISVHTTDPELRVRMMANPNAANIMPMMKSFSEAGINMRCQIVLCKGINDNDNLQKTMEDIKSLYPAVSSVSIVPVGLTKHREGLYPLLPLTKDDCISVIKQVDAFGNFCKKELNTRLFYCADEFYMKADIPLPGYSYYEDFEQIENGVGSLIAFAQEFNDVFRSMQKSDRQINISLITGEITESFITKLIDMISKKYSNLKCRVYAVKNNFFGENITVTGLITGQDIINQLKDKEIGDFLLIPEVMLRDKKFLDDVTIKDVEKALKIKVKTVPNNAEGFIESITGIN